MVKVSSTSEDEGQGSIAPGLCKALGGLWYKAIIFIFFPLGVYDDPAGLLSPPWACGSESSPLGRRPQLVPGKRC